MVCAQMVCSAAATATVTGPKALFPAARRPRPPPRQAAAMAARSQTQSTPAVRFTKSELEYSPGSRFNSSAEKVRNGT